MLTVDRQMGLNIVHPEGKVRANLRGAGSVDHRPRFTLECAAYEGLLARYMFSQRRRSSNVSSTTPKQTRAYYIVGVTVAQVARVRVGIC